jgi:DNA-binding GntR family transcriptional regulator
LYSHCDNSLLIQSIKNLKRRVNRYHFVTVTVPWQFDTYLEQHETILQACERNDGEMVEKYMKEHMDTTKEALKNQLQNRGVVF